MKEPTINRILGINATRRGLIKTENSFIFSSANNLNLEGKIITFSNSISCLSLKHDLVAIGFKGVNANLAILNLKNSAILSQFKGHKFGVEAASFSPSNSTIVSIGQDNVIHLWDYILNVKLASCKLSIHLNSICFHPSGTFFITSGLNHIKYWFISPDSVKIEGKYAVMGDHKNSDFLDLSCLITQEKTNIYTITKSALLILFGESRLMEKWVELKADYGTCITTCDKFIICGCSNSIIRLFQPDSLLYIATLPKPHLNTNSYPDTVSLSIDSTCTKLSVIYSDHSLFTWDLSDIKNITAIDSQLFQKDCIWGVETHPKFTWNSVNLNQDIPQNSFVTYSSDGTAMFWNLESPNQPFKIIYLESGIRSLKISNDGKWMVTGDKSGLVSIHDLSSFSLYKSIQAHEGEILAIDFSLQHDGLFN